MTGKELWDYMSKIQGDMQTGTTGYEWESLPFTVQYVWVKAAEGLQFKEQK